MYERIEQHMDREVDEEIGQETEQGQVLLPDAAAHDD
jgi:ADP-ribose pyrophosphatase YjhB (NUDIX family)